MRVIIETRAVSPSGLSGPSENSNSRGPAHLEILHVIGDGPLAHFQRCGQAVRGAHLARSPLLIDSNFLADA